MRPARKSISQDDATKWLLHHLHVLQAKALTANIQLSKNYKEKIKEVPNSSPNEVNIIGESLLLATVKYISDKEQRLKYIQLLIDRGADVNLQDRRDQRTALMHACIEDDRTEEGLLIMKVARLFDYPINEGCNLNVQDRLGNTALMYAAMKGRNELMNHMVDKLCKGWGLATLQLSNCMGHTAEDLAIRNGQHRCARIVQAQRLHILACLNRQMDMAGRISCRQWNAFAAIYKCADKWKPRQRRKSEDSRSLLSVQAKSLLRKKSM